MNRGLLSRVTIFLLVLTFFGLATARDGIDEQSQIAILQGGDSPREKDAACLQLKRIGTAKSVPALAALLTDDQLSHSARNALESMPASEAGDALVAALAKTSGSKEVGIINSLAVRKDPAAIATLSGLLSDANEDVAVAASEALGRIGGANSVAALESAATSPAEAVNEARTDARLTIANALLAQGEAGAAQKIFQRIYDNEKKENIRLAAFRGLILSTGQDGADLISSAISGEDAARQSAALQLASKLEGANVTKALADLLAKTQPPAQIALLRCLAERGDGEAMAAVARQTDSPDSDVRLSAISALGDLGDGSVAAALAQKAAATTGTERNAARQSLLDLRHGDVNGAMLAAVAEAEPKVRLELLRALGNRGAKSALPKLIELAQNDDDSIRAASWQAVSSLAGQAQIPDLVQLVVDAKGDDARAEAAEALGVVYQRIQSQSGHADASPLAIPIRQGPVAARVSLLPICGGLNDPAAREILRAAVKDQDAQVRGAAIGAVCETHDPEMLADLIQLAKGTEENKFRLMAIGDCVRLMTQEEKIDVPLDGKLSAFKTILESPLDAAERRMILSGLGVVPDERALAMTLPFLDDSEVRPEAVRAVNQIAGAIYAAHPETAGAAFKKVLDLSADSDAQNAARTGLQHIQELATYVTAWQIAGPYTQAGKNYAALFDIAFPPEEATGAASVKWQPLQAGTDAAQPWKLDLLKALGGEQRVAYARTWVYSPGERAARLEIGADDGLKVWFGGQLIHGNNASRGLQPGSDKMDVTLRQGWNPLLLKITQNTLGWEFCVRVVAPDGAAIAGVRASNIPQG